MNNQLYFFTGENTFSLAEELLRWKHGFLEKHGEANLSILAGKQLSFSRLLEEIRTAPFLGEKRLVLVDGMPINIDKEQSTMLPSLMHPATLLAVVDCAPDKRKSVTKYFLKEATVKSFGKKTPKELVLWLVNLAKEYKFILDASVAAHLIAIVGTDQWHLKNECLKLLTYVTENPTMDDVDRICLPNEKHTIWKMSDLIGKGKTLESVQFAKKLHDSGEDAFALWNIFLWIARNMAILWIWQKEKNLPIGVLSKESGIPFPSVQALLPRLRNKSEAQMRTFVERIVQADEALKTGKIKASTIEQVELMTVLERELLAC